jgi:hypothetical protein
MYWIVFVLPIQARHLGASENCRKRDPIRIGPRFTSARRSRNPRVSILVSGRKPELAQIQESTDLRRPGKSEFRCYENLVLVPILTFY